MNLVCFFNGCQRLDLVTNNTTETVTYRKPVDTITVFFWLQLHAIANRGKEIIIFLKIIFGCLVQ